MGSTRIWATSHRRCMAQEPLRWIEGEVDLDSYANISIYKRTRQIRWPVLTSYKTIAIHPGSDFLVVVGVMQATMAKCSRWLSGVRHSVARAGSPDQVCHAPPKMVVTIVS